MRTFKRTTIFFVICIVAVTIFTAMWFCDSQQQVAFADSTQSINLPEAIYDFDDNSGYNYSLANQVSRMSNGYTSLGTLSISGKKLTQSTYNNVTAIGLDEGTSLTFTYKQSVSSGSYIDQTWYLSNDSATSICGYNTGTIGNGAILVLSSEDGASWSYVTSMVGINGKTFTYTPKASEIKEGRYYRFLSAAEVYYDYQYVSGSHMEYSGWWNSMWRSGGKRVYEYSWASYYRNLGQESTVYVCMNSASVAFCSEATKNYKIEDDSLTKEQIELLQKGTTLTDGSVSMTFIQVDNLGCTCYKMQYCFNDGDWDILANGDKFTQQGKYIFKIGTPLGKFKTTTIYLIDNGNDLGYSQYFGTGLIDSELRIYNDTIAIPTYATGKTYTICPQSKFLPGLYGEITHYQDIASIQQGTGTKEKQFIALVENYEGTFEEEGIYEFSLFSGNPDNNSGELVHYTFLVAIQDRNGYAPTVNQKLLTSVDRNCLLSRKVYAVTLPTAGGGNYVFCNPFADGYYETAYSIAERIEYLSVEEYEQNGNSYWYYKDPNSNTKKKYTTKSNLFKAIAFFAERNVCVLYLEADVEYLSKAADNEALKDLAAGSIRNDVCVVTDEETKKLIQASEVYVNDFQFVQVAEFESSVVMALDEDRNVHYIPYGVSLNTLFDKTQKLRITEVNWNGEAVYDVIYYQKNENTASITALINHIETEIDWSDVECDSFSILCAGDDYDSQSIVNVLNTGTESREVMLLTEFEGFAFAQNTDYEVVVTNRFGGTRSFKVFVHEDPIVAEQESEVIGRDVQAKLIAKADNMPELGLTAERVVEEDIVYIAGTAAEMANESGVGIDTVESAEKMSLSQVVQNQQGEQAGLPVYAIVFICAVALIIIVALISFVAIRCKTKKN